MVPFSNPAATVGVTRGSSVTSRACGDVLEGAGREGAISLPKVSPAVVADSDGPSPVGGALRAAYPSLAARFFFPAVVAFTAWVP
jgi:hypothetical protein